MSELFTVNKTALGYSLTSDSVSATAIPSGTYKAYAKGMSSTPTLEVMPFVSDDIVPLPNAAYANVIKQFNTFTSKDTKELYKRYGCVYKRSTLLYGAPGTGKTCIVNQVVIDAVKQGAVVIFPQGETGLIATFLFAAQIKRMQPGQLVVVILEEFDSFARNYERTLLTLLDGQDQFDSIMYLATTNYINQIPKRLLRPGRISSLIEVGFPDAAAREAFLKAKFKGELPNITKYVEASEGLSIDQLKELVISTLVLKESFSDSLARLREAGPNIKESTLDDEVDNEDF